MFELHLFDSRYHRTTGDDITVLNKDASSLNQNELMEFDENESHRSSITLTKREKYKMVIPLLTSIGDLVSCYSTDQFLAYLDEW